MLAVTGFKTTIVKALALATGDPVHRIHADLADPITDFLLPEGATRFLIAQGVLHAARVQTLDAQQIADSVAVNLVNVMRLVEHILATVKEARIVVIGSLSAQEGSHDQLYAACKAGVHSYVTWRLVQAPQLLACIAPTIIADSGMTERRADFPAVLERRPSVSAAQVAEMCRKVLYCVDADVSRVNNSIIFMNGEPQRK